MTEEFMMKVLVAFCILASAVVYGCAKKSASDSVVTTSGKLTVRGLQ